jgi:glycosyltransferase involved in cell wall biosynthesis
MEERRIRVAALTGGEKAPSARFRVRQLIPSLKNNGIDLDEKMPHVAAVPPANRKLRPIWGFAALVERIPYVIDTYRYDAVILQRELLSTLSTLECLTKHPRILDVDDAIFLRRNGVTAARLARWSDLVVCGNDFLAETFCRWNNNIEVIPTAVDATRFRPREESSDIDRRMIIGWIGTSGNFKYLREIETALESIMKREPHVYFRVVADREPSFGGILRERLEYIPWSAEIEVESIQEMTVGIMPLSDDEWCRGKCSYKMLQYMACGIPVVVSPVGMNGLVLAQAEVGLAAETKSQWIDNLMQLLHSVEQRREFGKNGRRLILVQYDVPIIATRLASCLKRNI